MKRQIRTPFFEIGIKNYIFGDDVLHFAKAADGLAKKYDIDVILIVPYTEIRRVSESAGNLFVFAPHMDTLRPGRGMADVLPEAVKAAGASGVVINHCERPLPLSAIGSTIQRANELELISFVCAGSIAEAKAAACFCPDIINPEEDDKIGSGNVSGFDFVKASTLAIKSINPGTLVEQAAGITNGKQVYDLIVYGCEGVGAASGIFKSANPVATSEEMIAAVRRAINGAERRGRYENNTRGN